MSYRKAQMFLIGLALLSLVACSAKIYGTVQLVDEDMKPIPDDNPKGTVVNMINTSVSVENASHAVVADEKGKFESEEDTITPGVYKVEASRIGYVTETETVEIGGSTSKKLKFALKKIPEGKRRSIAGASSDADKIINPGEVNIQPPGI
ncbi:MAG: carboxypeptidase-like regulatory domain-containing protein [Deltaproteobacteria bacterium]|nr:carboxypeptidase-like regulatory domain-containing protein [Deltaproteobacteria bacterium]